MAVFLTTAKTALQDMREKAKFVDGEMQNAACINKESFLNKADVPCYCKMEIKIVDDKKNKLIFEIKGADHTLCNILKTELLNDKHIKIATYSIRHPQISVPQMIVETDGEIAPRSAVAGAVSRLHKHNEKFLSEFKKEIK